MIGSARGGITDYTWPAQTGWLNRTVTGAELAEIMGRLAGDPEEIDAVRGRVVGLRAKLVKPLAAHLDELDAVYRELAGAS